MAVSRAHGPYIWVTWLTRLLVGEHSCEWAAWFRSHHESRSWEKVPNPFSQVEWQMRHTAAISECRRQWEDLGYRVFTENQNSFVLRGRSAALGGKPDLIARKGCSGTIMDIKTGRPSPSHSVQVMLYMYAIPLALKQYGGIAFDGQVVYPDGVVEIPASSVNSEFIQRTAALIRRIGADAPAPRVPSGQECRFCDITLADCPERMGQDIQEDGQTTDF